MLDEIIEKHFTDNVLLWENMFVEEFDALKRTRYRDKWDYAIFDKVNGWYKVFLFPVSKMDMFSMGVEIGRILEADRKY